MLILVSFYWYPFEKEAGYENDRSECTRSGDVRMF
jgi:hypothetical protein